MFISRKTKSNLSFSTLFVVLLFVFQTSLLIVLSVFYPPTRFRTSSKEFFSDFTEYFALSSFIIGLFLRGNLLNRVAELLREFPRIINWSSTRCENGIQNFKEEWMTKAFDRGYPLLYALIVCATFFILVRTLGVIERREPLILTLVWVLDDFTAIVGLTLILYVSCIVSLLIYRISKISIHTLNVFHIDRMGGLSAIGNLASFRSLFLGFVLGIWFVPWLLKCIFTPFLRARLALGLATSQFEFLIVGAITLLPFSFFIIDAWVLHKYVAEFKEKTTDELSKDYWALYKKVVSATKYNWKTRHGYVRMQTLESRIEKIRRLKEWPFGSTNIAQITLTIILPLFELVFKQLISS